MNFLDGTVTQRSTEATVRFTGVGLVRVPNLAGAETGSAVSLGIRPDAITLAEAGSGDLAGTVAVVEHLGGMTLVYVAIDGLADLVTVERAGTAPSGSASAWPLDRCRGLLRLRRHRPAPSRPQAPEPSGRPGHLTNALDGYLRPGETPS